MKSMIMLKGLSLLQKVLLALTLALVLATVVSSVVFVKRYKESALTGIIEESREVTRIAENARNYAARLRKSKAFDDVVMIKELKSRLGGAKGRQDILDSVRGTVYYQTIPIVAAWTVGQENAEKNSREFRVIRIGARNKAREADVFERGVLEKMAGEKLGEYWLLDEKSNALRYFRPITLTQECMLCHGNEKDYPEGKGMDPLGLPMEGWKAGEQRGAFEIITDLAPMQRHVASTRNNIAVVGLTVLSLAGAFTGMQIRRGIVRPVMVIAEEMNNGAAEAGKAALSVSETAEGLRNQVGHQRAAIANVSTAMEEISQTAEGTARNDAESERRARRVGRD